MTEKSAHTATSPDQPPSNDTPEKLKLNMSEAERMRRDSSARESTQTSPAPKPENGPSSSPKKRRKVNHGKQTAVPMQFYKDHGSGSSHLLPRSRPDHVANSSATRAACVYCRRSVSRNSWPSWLFPFSPRVDVSRNSSALTLIHLRKETRLED